MCVRVIDLKASPIEVFTEIDGAAPEVIGANPINHHADSVQFREKVILAAFVENHAVLHTRASSSFNKYPEISSRRGGLLGQHLRNLARGAGSEVDYGVLSGRLGLCNCRHG